MGAAALLGAPACGPAMPDASSQPAQGIAIVCDPADALLFVDDRYVGTVAGLRGRPLPLAEGSHRIEVRRDGYHAHYAEISIAKGVRQRLEVKLRKELF